MELSAQSSSGENILYYESFWTGKRRLVINGQEALKVGKKQFRIQEDGNVVNYEAKGSFLTGVTVTSTRASFGEEAATGVANSVETTVLARNTWYDWIMICLPLVGIIFGVAFCGAIGGGASALLCLLGAMLNANIARAHIPVVGKIFAQLGVAAVANVIWFGIWYVVALWVLSLI